MIILRVFHFIIKNLVLWIVPRPILLTKELASQYDTVVLFGRTLTLVPNHTGGGRTNWFLIAELVIMYCPDNVVIVAGNRETDKGVTYRMSVPLANRFVHLEMRVDYDSGCSGLLIMKLVQT